MLIKDWKASLWMVCVIIIFVLYKAEHFVLQLRQRNLLPLLMQLLLSNSSKGSFICATPQTEQHIPQPLINQLWTTGISISCLRARDKKNPLNWPGIEPTAPTCKVGVVAIQPRRLSGMYSNLCNCNVYCSIFF